MNESVYINNAEVVSTTVASNGQVHELDAVIFPIGHTETLKEEIYFGPDYSGFQSLVTIATEAGDTLNDPTAMFTVFSPNSAVISDDMKAMNATQLLPVIGRHIVRGKVIFSNMLMDQSTPLPTVKKDSMINVKVMDNTVFVDSDGYWSKVESFDESTSNGVIHVINGVLGVRAGVNVYEALGLFDPNKFGSYLSKISEYAELKKDLKNVAKMFTVFSPQNTAWEDLSTLQISEHRKVLKRHVVIGKLTAEELINKTEVITLSDEKLMVKNEHGKVYLEFGKVKAEVTSTNNMAVNGVIHVIDEVLRTRTSNHNKMWVYIVIPLAVAVLLVVLTILYLRGHLPCKRHTHQQHRPIYTQPMVKT